MDKKNTADFLHSTDISFLNLEHKYVRVICISYGYIFYLAMF